MPPEVRRLSELSARIGRDLMLVQGPGGNTSIKCDDLLWVKASGTWLADAGVRPIFVPLHLSGVRRRLAAGEPDPCANEIADVPGAASLRPSIETTMHALMPQRVVVHVHSVRTIALAVRADVLAALSPRLSGLRWSWIPYARPGLPLARAMTAAIADRPEVIVLANHGLVIAADDIESAGRLLADVERRLDVAPRVAPQANRDVLGPVADAIGYKVADGEEGHAAATDPGNVALALRGALYPDHVVFLGRSPLIAVTVADAVDTMTRRRARREADPPILLVRAAGVLARPDIGRSAEEMIRCLGLVLARLDRSAPIVVLEPAEEMELLGWDAEKHRQALDRQRAGNEPGNAAGNAAGN